MSLAARLDVPDGRGGGRGRGASHTNRRSPRPGPYSKPSSAADNDLWTHDKFAEVNDMPSGGLAGRISSGDPNRGSSSKLFSEALNASGVSKSRPGAGRTSSGGISIRGASRPSSTCEVRELIAGTTTEDVQLIFGTCGVIKSATSIPSKNPATSVVRLTYETRSGMLAAIEQFNGKTADGRTLSVIEVSNESAPSVPRGRDLLDDSESGAGGKMYSDSIAGGVTVTNPPRINTQDNWRGRGGKRGRGGRGRGSDRKDDGMQMD